LLLLNINIEILCDPYYSLIIFSYTYTYSIAFAIDVICITFNLLIINFNKFFIEIHILFRSFGKFSLFVHICTNLETIPRVSSYDVSGSLVYASRNFEALLQEETGLFVMQPKFNAESNFWYEGVLFPYVFLQLPRVLASMSRSGNKSTDVC